MDKGVFFFVFRLFPPEISGHFSPFGGFPLDNRITIVMGVEPILGTGDNLIELLRPWGALQGCLAFTLTHPEDGVVGVGIDGLVIQPLLPG